MRTLLSLFGGVFFALGLIQIKEEHLMTGIFLLFLSTIAMTTVGMSIYREHKR